MWEAPQVSGKGAESLSEEPSLMRPAQGGHRPRLQVPGGDRPRPGMRGSSEASRRTRTQGVPRTAGSQEGVLWGPQRHATCSGSPRCWDGT